MNRVVITGGPATGKTSLVNTLQKKGYTTFKEVAREVIKEQLSLNSNKVPWDDVSGFSKLVLQEQIQDFEKANDHLTFYDRGIPDIIGYMNHGGQKLFGELISHAEKLRYSKIFILPPWQEIYAIDNERRENFEEATQLFTKINNAYSSLKYEPIVVPKLKIDERIQFVLDNING